MNIVGTPADISNRHPWSKISVVDTVSSWVISTQTPAMWETIVDDGTKWKKNGKKKNMSEENQEFFMYGVFMNTNVDRLHTSEDLTFLDYK